MRQSLHWTRLYELDVVEYSDCKTGALTGALWTPPQIKDTKCAQDFYPDELSLIFVDQKEKKKKNQMYSFFFQDDTGK